MSENVISAGKAPSVDQDLMLEVENLSVTYGTGPRPIRAVDGVDLCVHRGEVLGIVGESGSGKSTLAFAVTRLLRRPGQVGSGTVTYHPRQGEPVDLLRLNASQLRTLRWSAVSIVFQSAMNTLNPVLRLREHFADTLRTHRPGISREEIQDRTSDLLSLVGITPDRANAYAHELSGGMRQRAMIALALALDPEIIVMDEPTTALDVVLQRQILSEVMLLQDRLRFSVIFITHDLSLLIELADTVMVMYAGRVVEIAASSDIHNVPRHPYSIGLLNSFPLLEGPRRELIGIPGSPPDLRALPSGCSFHPRCPSRVAGCDMSLPELELSGCAGDSPDHKVACFLYGRSDNNRALPELLRLREAYGTSTDLERPATSPASPLRRVLEARNLSKAFPVRSGTVHAVDSVSFSLFAGRVTALVGESGSGKSTIARLLAQLCPSSAGEIALHGKTVRATRGRALREYVRQVQLILQDPFASLNPLHTVSYHLERPLRVHGYARTKEEVRVGVAALLEEVSLTPVLQFAEKYPHELSGGQRQRISVARALAARPAVILADEPVSMLDVSIRLSLLNLLLRLTAAHEMALLYITHDIASARYFAQDIMVMYAGQLVESGPADTVVARPAHPYTRLLIDSSPAPGRRIRLSNVDVGEPPSMVRPPQGCRFQSRCPHVMKICATNPPPVVEVGENQLARCWLHAPSQHLDAQAAAAGRRKEVVTELAPSESGDS